MTNESGQEHCHMGHPMEAKKVDVTLPRRVGLR